MYETPLLGETQEGETEERDQSEKQDRRRHAEDEAAANPGNAGGAGGHVHHIEGHEKETRETISKRGHAQSREQSGNLEERDEQAVRHANGESVQISRRQGERDRGAGIR